MGALCVKRTSESSNFCPPSTLTYTQHVDEQLSFSSFQTPLNLINNFRHQDGASTKAFRAFCKHFPWSAHISDDLTGQTALGV